MTIKNYFSQIKLLLNSFYDGYLTSLLPKIDPDVFVNEEGALNVVLELPKRPPDVVFAPKMFVCPVCPNILVPVLVPNPPKYTSYIITSRKSHNIPTGKISAMHS